MSLNLTPDQQQQLESLGINLSKDMPKLSKHIKNPVGNRLLPLLSISGLTLLSFGGVFFLKSKLSASTPTPSVQPSPVQSTEPDSGLPAGRQVPKSIQHYLLTSQQYFTQALSLQPNKPTGQPNSELVELLNQSIIAASSAIQEFPNDYRGYEQRGRIYQSLLSSQPQLLSTAIADFSAASVRNPDSADLTRTLASLYALQGDSQSTLNYLTRTIDLDPTTAQNFYDLARIQQQLGLIPQALSTYNRLLTIVADPSQKQAVALEKSALENLLSQNPIPKDSLNGLTGESPTSSPLPNPDGPLIQANTGLPALVAELPAGLIIAAPETRSDLTISNLSTSNSLSGDGTLSASSAQITLTNSLLTPSAQIYVTAISGPKNTNLQILSRSPNSFTVGLDSPVTEDIKFKWWIVK